jgi:hypothetical protein
LGGDWTNEQVSKLVLWSCRHVAHALRPSVGADDRWPPLPDPVEPGGEAGREHHLLIVP